MIPLSALAIAGWCLVVYQQCRVWAAEERAREAERRGDALAEMAWKHVRVSEVHVLKQRRLRLVRS